MATLQGGLLGPDPGALSPAQQEQLRNFKIQTRIANEKYLRTHKEVELLISGFFRLDKACSPPQQPRRCRLCQSVSAARPTVRPAVRPLRSVDCIIPPPLWVLPVKRSHQPVGLHICPTTREPLKD
uniref:RIIa domain-containing protein 1 isoform X4 n=1 Tax=Halichoerus grypus TaxID=9711 RepID=UPI001658CB37|nr:RIIa domain-containing protein 1 isoform X4 [Halichoerus grypus]